MSTRVKHPEKLDDLIKHGSIYEIQAVQRRQAIAVASKVAPKKAIYVNRKQAVKQSIEREFNRIKNFVR